MKKSRILLGYALFVVCFLASIGIMILSEIKGTSLLINLLFAVIMFGIIILAVRKIRKFLKFIKALSDGTAILSSLPKEETSRFTDGREVFHDNEKLAGLLTKYYTENTGYEGKISDYINEDVLDDEINKQVTELIAGVMTGLGLLGTFIGFMVGIKDLNLNQEELFDSIKTLMDGMKTAFLTSIFGVIYSLLFSWYYKQMYSSGRQELERFYDAFSEKVASNPENRNINLMVEYQRRQIEELEKLPLTISTTVAQEIDRVFAPTISRMDILMERFVDVATTNQQESLEKLVNAFIDSMNEILNDKFVLLSETLDRTCQLQKTNFEMISSNSDINKHFLELLKASISCDCDMFIDEKLWDGIEQQHHELWKSELQKHQINSNELITYKLGTLTTSHQSRIRFIQEMIRKSNNTKIRMMREAELRNATADFEMRKRKLEQTMNQVDIVASKLSYGVLMVETISNC